MTNWKLKINISKEIKELKELCENLDEGYEFEGEIGDNFMELCRNLKHKFSSFEDKIKEVTEDDGTFEQLENELEDLEMSCNVENSNYCLENIYELCDVASIWLEQLSED